MLMMTLGASAQIVTSKKEAQKKGTYNYTEKPSQPAQARATSNDKPLTVTDSDMASLLGSSPVIAYEPVKEIRRGGPSKLEAPSKKKSILLDSGDDDITPSTDNYLAEQLVNNAMQFEGVRYRGGGTTTAGMDCSGMVTAVFRIFDLSLPRSSHEMAKQGVEIPLAEVKKGDLLFFKNNPRRSVINHVGLVTEVTEEGEVKFIHASSSSGVIVSSMNEAYHKRTFVQANRVVGN